MRWFKFSVVVLLVFFGIYAAAMYFFADENKSFTIEKELNYPVDKVFPQFNNLQNFVQWNNYFSSKDLAVDYFRPYQGKGSAISFHEKKKDNSGEMYIRYSNLNKTLRYQLFEKDDRNPYLIDIKFIPLSKSKTKIIWYVHSPKLPLLERSANLWAEESFVDNLDKSMVNLNNVLSNKVDKDEQIKNIKYDSIMVENYPGELLLGINVSTSNKKDALYKSIVLNHNKVYNFLTVDMDKKDDEIGFPVLITDPGNYKSKEVSYFYGIPVSKKSGITDNNFSFRPVSPSKAYVVYFKGNYASRQRSVQMLVQKAKRDSLRNGDILQTFIHPPKEDQDVIVKLILPVYK